MMVEPGMDALLAKVDSKYTLVSVCAKRARVVMKKESFGMENPVTVALNQIANGKVLWERQEQAGAPEGGDAPVEVEASDAPIEAEAADAPAEDATAVADAVDVAEEDAPADDEAAADGEESDEEA